MFAWASAILELAALVWPRFISMPIPLPDMRRFAALPYAPILLMASVFFAVWLSVPHWHTRARMIRVAWIVGPIGFLAMFFLGTTFGFPLVWTAMDVRRATSRKPEAPSVAEPIACLVCGAQLAADASSCEKCGWTFETS